MKINSDTQKIKLKRKGNESYKKKYETRKEEMFL